MQIEERIYYEEEQKMEANWIWILILISSISMIGAACAFLVQDHSDWLTITLVLGAILLSDGLMLFLFRNMKLELAMSKKGLHYKMTTLFSIGNMVNWNDVTTMGLRKSPTRGYGKKYKFRYGEVYAMNLKIGVELVLKDGKKKFFSLKDPEEFKRNFRKLELPLQIE